MCIKKYQKTNKKSGFTIPPILIALAIICIITTISIAFFSNKKNISYVENYKITKSKIENIFFDMINKNKETFSSTNFGLCSQSDSNADCYKNIIRNNSTILTDTTNSKFKSKIEELSYIKLSETIPVPEQYTEINNSEANKEFNPWKETKFTLKTKMGILLGFSPINSDIKSYINEIKSPQNSYEVILVVDTNGEKKPNKTGNDLFYFIVNSQGELIDVTNYMINGSSNIPIGDNYFNEFLSLKVCGETKKSCRSKNTEDAKLTTINLNFNTNFDYVYKEYDASGNIAGMYEPCSKDRDKICHIMHSDNTSKVYDIHYSFDKIGNLFKDFENVRTPQRLSMTKRWDIDNKGNFYQNRIRIEEEDGSGFYNEIRISSKGELYTYSKILKNSDGSGYIKSWKEDNKGNIYKDTENITNADGSSSIKYWNEDSRGNIYQDYESIYNSTENKTTEKYWKEDNNGNIYKYKEVITFSNGAKQNKEYNSDGSIKNNE